jgi:Ca2+-transporting ATPase
MEHTGLNENQVLLNRNKFGLNEIKSQNEVSLIKIALRQIKSPLIYILIAATVFSLVLKEYKDALFIIIVVFINSALGLYQEYKAEKTLSSLQKQISKVSKVIRNGEVIKIPTIELVPDDVIILEQGMQVPADAKLIEANELAIDESILTGESEPVEKDIDGEIFKGTKIVSGIGKAVVLKIGMQTKFGVIASKLENESTVNTPTQMRLALISKVITIIIALIISLVIILGLVRGIETEEILLTSIALAVSTIPEGLIISYTIVLALGMNRIMKRKAIVKNLPAAETLGSVDVLCIDKTGTLTLGEMNVTGIESELDEKLINRILLMSNNDSNFVDVALRRFVNQNLAENEAQHIQNQRLKLFPFSSKEKYSAAIDDENAYIVGAPEKLFQLMRLNESEINMLERNVREKGEQGIRVLAFGYKKIKKHSIERSDLKDFELGGIIFINDPIRKSVKNALVKVQNSGIELKVITGDMLITAKAILGELGIKLSENEILSGEDLERIKGNGDFDEIVNKVKLFYRTTPDQKLDIVQAIQRLGKTVGMMGDGVNDSPAIFNAEIGIGVDSATDVSKEAADIILLDSNFETIYGAIEEGRNIFQNMKKIFIYLFVGSFTETILILLSLIFNIPLPLLPLQLLWINLIEDGLPSIALGFDKNASLTKKKFEKVLDNSTFIIIFLAGIVADLMLFILYYSTFKRTGDVELSRTIIFGSVSISSLLFLYSAKTFDSNIWKEKFWNNKVANLSVLLGIFMTFVAIYFAPIANILELESIEFRYWGIVFGVSFLVKRLIRMKL